jgi:hypothetical protein
MRMNGVAFTRGAKRINTPNNFNGKPERAFGPLFLFA